MAPLKGFKAGLVTLLVLFSIILLLLPGCVQDTLDSEEGKSGHLVAETDCLTCGKQTERYASNDISVVTVTGAQDDELGSPQNSFSTYTMMIKSINDSSPISLSDLVINVETKNTSQSFQYTSDGVGDTSHYNVSYLKLGPENKPGYLSGGDIIKLNFVSVSPIGEGVIVKMRVILKGETIIPLDLVTPEVIDKTRIILYPA